MYFRCRVCCCSNKFFLNKDLLVGEPGFEPGVTRTQNEHVSRYTTPRTENSFLRHS